MNKQMLKEANAESLKDAAVLHHSLSDPTKAVKPHGQARYARLCAEQGLGE